MLAQLPYLGLDGLEVLKGFRTLAHIPQQSGGVVNGRHLNAAPGKPLSVLAGDFEIFFDNRLGGDTAKANDDFRPQQRCLPAEPANTWPR